MTSDQTSNMVAPVAVDELPVLPFQFLETRPGGITWHMIFDHELDYLTNISRPIVLGLATTFLGAVLGLVPSILSVFQLVAEGKPVGYVGAGMLALSGLCLAFTMGLGFFACKGQVDALAKKREIRARQASPASRRA